MFRHYSIADGKPKPRTFTHLLSCEEGFEDLGHVFLRYSGTGITYLYNDSMPALVNAKGQLSTSQHRVDGVGCKGDHGLLQLPCVCRDKGYLRLQFNCLDDTAPSLLVRDQVCGRTNNLPNVNPPSLTKGVRK